MKYAISTLALLAVAPAGALRAFQDPPAEQAAPTVHDSVATYAQIQMGRELFLDVTFFRGPNFAGTREPGETARTLTLVGDVLYGPTWSRLNQINGQFEVVLDSAQPWIWTLAGVDPAKVLESHPSTPSSWKISVQPLSGRTWSEVKDANDLLIVAVEQ